jgi:hypothetical protein
MIFFTADEDVPQRRKVDSRQHFTLSSRRIRVFSDFEQSAYGDPLGVDPSETRRENRTARRNLRRGKNMPEGETLLRAAREHAAENGSPRKRHLAGDPERRIGDEAYFARVRSH